MSAILKEDVPELSETARNVPPGLERIVRHCLEKNPAQRFHSASDIAFDLEALTEISATTKSGAQAAVAHASSTGLRRKLAGAVGVLALTAAAAGLGWWLGRGSGAAPLPEYQQVTFRTGFLGNARFTPDGSVVYNASWEGGPSQLYMPTPRDSIYATVSKGIIYVIGGFSSGARLPTVESFNPATNQWTTKAPMRCRELGTLK